MKKKNYIAAILVIIQFLCIAFLLFNTDLRWQFTIGNLLILLGITLGLWSIYAMKSNEWGVSPIPKSDAFLITKKPYRYIRHPMYSAVLFFCLGLVLENPSLWNCIVYGILLIDLLIKLNWEEQMLSEKYPDYKTYQKKTKKLIPFIF